MSRCKVTVANGRVTIKCEKCDVSMTVDGQSAFGAHMVAQWPVAHICIPQKRAS